MRGRRGTAELFSGGCFSSSQRAPEPIADVGDLLHKKKNNTVLAGEMILTFHKSGKKKRMGAGKEFDLNAAVERCLESEHGPIYSEAVFNRLVIEAWTQGAIGALGIERTRLSELIGSMGWEYDKQRHWWVRALTSQRSLFA